MREFAKLAPTDEVLKSDIFPLLGLGAVTDTGGVDPAAPAALRAKALLVLSQTRILFEDAREASKIVSPEQPASTQSRTNGNNGPEDGPPIDTNAFERLQTKFGEIYYFNFDKTVRCNDRLLEAMRNQAEKNFFRPIDIKKVCGPLDSSAKFNWSESNRVKAIAELKRRLEMICNSYALTGVQNNPDGFMFCKYQAVMDFNIWVKARIDAGGDNIKLEDLFTALKATFAHWGELVTTDKVPLTDAINMSYSYAAEQFNLAAFTALAATNRNTGAKGKGDGKGDGKIRKTNHEMSPALTAAINALPDGKKMETWQMKKNDKWICKRFQVNMCSKDKCRFAHICANPRCNSTDHGICDCTVA